MPRLEQAGAHLFCASWLLQIGPTDTSAPCERAGGAASTAAQITDNPASIRRFMAIAPRLARALARPPTTLFFV
jgi:hypothetical protein